MSLRGEPVELETTLPDGRHVRVRVGVPEDPYIPRRDLDTVDVELFHGDEALAAVSTLLSPDHTGEARRLARRIADALASGELEPTAGAIEPLAEGAS